MIEESMATIPEKKQWLNRARGIEEELYALRETKKRATSKATNTTAQYKEVIVSSSHDPHKLDRVASLATTIRDRENELEKIQAEIIKAIGTVQSAEFRTLLIQRYVNGKTWHEIAESLHRSEPRVHDKHRAALEEINITRDMINQANSTKKAAEKRNRI